MLMRIMIVVFYIASCIRVGAAPWRYFQLNARYFSDKKGIFSKIDIDALIPDRWRLKQYYDDGVSVPESFPVFVKPEWGQNAFGIKRADNIEALTQIRSKIEPSETAYIIQHAASENREFEIFTIPDNVNKQKFTVLTITEALNSENEEYPINSIDNKSTSFKEITDQFDQNQLDIIWSYIRQLGDFNISRVCVHANSVPELVQGEFHNLFVPMPINLMDKKYNWPKKTKFIFKCMMALAKLTKNLNPRSTQYAIFTKKLLYQHKARSLNLSHTREIL